MKNTLWLLLCILLWACSNTTSPPEGVHYSQPFVIGISSPSVKSSSSTTLPSESVTDIAFWESKWVQIPEQEMFVESKWIPIASFKILETEITQLMYAEVLDTLPPQKELKENYPVASVSWYDAILFCNALSKNLGYDTAYRYSSIGPKNTLLNLTFVDSIQSVRLPTNIEWEAAIRGTTTTEYFWGTGNASEFAHYGSTGGAIEVGQKRVNSYGLYDMAGTVHEWVYDWDGPYGTTVGSKRIYRGGSWSSPLSQLASDYQSSALPDESTDTRGFRVVLSNGVME
jgi:formylglycine-generating enzyme required for sulfatase activity